MEDCLLFGGSEYVQITNPNINIREFSVSFRALTAVNTNNSGFNDWLSINGASGGEFCLETQGSLASPSGYRISGFTGAGDVNSSPSIPLANKGWKMIHLVASQAGNYVRIYVNRVLTGSSSWAPGSEVISSIRFGSRGSASSRGIKAYMNQLRIFNSPLTQAEIDDDYYSGIYNTKLERQYLINEASGTSVVDTSGNGGSIGVITSATWALIGPMKVRTSS